MFPYQECLLEMNAQYQLFLKLTGKRPGYLHDHSLSHENYTDTIRQLSKEYPKTGRAFRIVQAIDTVYASTDVKTAEEKLVERISARISEKHPESSLLIPVLAGEISLRPRYYHAPYRRPSPYVLNTSFIVRHIPSGMFNFYATVPLFAGMSRISAVSPALRVFISETSRPWPAESSLFVDENYAVIMLTPEGIAAIRAQLPR